MGVDQNPYINPPNSPGQQETSVDSMINHCSSFPTPDLSSLLINKCAHPKTPSIHRYAPLRPLPYPSGIHQHLYLPLTSFFSPLQFQHLPHNLFLLQQKRPDDPLPHHRVRQTTPIFPADRLVTFRKPLATQLCWPPGFNPVQLCTRHSATWIVRFLLDILHHQPTAWSAHQSGTVRASSIRMPPSVGYTLCHFTPWLRRKAVQALLVPVFKTGRGRREQNNNKQNILSLKLNRANY